MLFDKMNILAMTPEYARLLSLWKYEGIYSFYDHNEKNIEGYMDGTHYACTNEDGELIGYFCFGNDARIPTIEKNVYDDNFIDIGLGLKPNLCGKGFGLSFINLGLEYAEKFLQAKCFRLSVAAFNVRAIKVYTKIGFVIDCEVTNSYFKNKFYIMKYKR